jgi:plastocyanin
VVLELKVPGTYSYECGIADHADRGMKGTFTVT